MGSRPYIALLTIVVIAGLAWFVARSGSDRTETSSAVQRHASSDTGERPTPVVAGDDKPVVPKSRVARRTETRSEFGGVSSTGRVPEDTPTVKLEAVVDGKTTPARTKSPTETGKGAEEAGWDDPTNSRVLGPKSWMAPTEEEEKERIDAVFEEWRQKRYDPSLPDLSRSASIKAVRAQVDECFRQLESRDPTASGRLILAWTAEASGGKGRVSDPTIRLNYKLEDATFEQCVLNRMRNAKFSGEDGEAVRVEAALFYDGSY